MHGNIQRLQMLHAQLSFVALYIICTCAWGYILIIRRVGFQIRSISDDKDLLHELACHLYLWGGVGVGSLIKVQRVFHPFRCRLQKCGQKGHPSSEGPQDGGGGCWVWACDVVTRTRLLLRCDAELQYINHISTSRSVQNDLCIPAGKLSVLLVWMLLRFIWHCFPPCSLLLRRFTLPRQTRHGDVYSYDLLLICCVRSLKFACLPNHSSSHNIQGVSDAWSTNQMLVTDAF